MIARRKTIHPRLLFSLLFACAVCSGFGAYFAWSPENERLQAWDKYLSEPLPSDIIHDLCSRDLIPSNVGDCDNKGLQIQHRSISDIVRANIVSSTTYNDMNRLFGSYFINCKEGFHWGLPTAAQSNVYQCQYELASYYFIITYQKATNLVLSSDFEES